MQTRIAKTADTPQVGAVSEPVQGDPELGVEAPSDHRARFTSIPGELAGEIFFEEFGALDCATHGLRCSRRMRSPMA
jgi:hypothetical protein